MTEKEKKAIEMLNKYIAEHKFFNIKQADNLEGNIEISINLIEKQQQELQNLQNIDKEHQKLNGELRDEIDDLKQLMAHKNGYTKQLEEDLFENASNYVVSKDKIREKIEEINDEKLNYSEDEYYLESEEKGYAIDKLKELLEEE